MFELWGSAPEDDPEDDHAEIYQNVVRKHRKLFLYGISLGRITTISFAYLLFNRNSFNSQFRLG